MSAAKLCPKCNAEITVGAIFKFMNFGVSGYR